MSELYWCDKNKVVWEVVPEVRKVAVYKKDKNGDFITSKNKKGYELETDENGEAKSKLYKRTIHIYKGYPSYGKPRKNIPDNTNDEYFIDSTNTPD
jgi:hypothetical protein